MSKCIDCGKEISTGRRCDSCREELIKKICQECKESNPKKDCGSCSEK